MFLTQCSIKTNSSINLLTVLFPIKLLFSQLSNNYFEVQMYHLKLGVFMIGGKFIFKKLTPPKQSVNVPLPKMGDPERKNKKNVVL